MEITVINLDDKKEYLVSVNKQGENLQRCPVCSDDRKKSKIKCFSFNYNKDAGKCSHCGVVLVKKKEFVPKFEKVEYKLPSWKNKTELSDKLIRWFEGRKISQKTLIEMKVTEGMEFMPQLSKEVNTSQFNYFRDGILINVKYRDGAKNFKLVSGAEMIFYNLDAVKAVDEIYIVEGEIDCLSFIEAGIKNVVSVPNGCTEKGNINLNYLDNCIEYFTDETKIYLALDNDFVGNRLRDEIARRLGVERCYKIYFKDCKDANECLVKYGINGIIEAIADKKEYPIAGVFNATDISDEIDDYYINGLPKGDGVGIEKFDELVKFHKGYITTITGIPGHGKSELLDFICCRLNVGAGWKFAMYSPENFPLQLHFSKIAEKLIGKSFVGYDKMTQGELYFTKNYFDNNFYFIKPESDFTLDNILSMVRTVIRKKGVSAFIIDAWNKLDHLYDTNETKYISQQLDKISMFCEINNVHCFLVAHPTKISKKEDGTYYVPNLYNISGSANFFNKTAIGISSYKNLVTGLSEVYIQKVKFKHWGITGMVALAWDKVTGRYYTGTPDYSNWIIKDGKQTSLIGNENNFLNEIHRVGAPREQKEPTLDEIIDEANNQYK
jgi:twinkle protein